MENKHLFKKKQRKYAIVTARCLNNRVSYTYNYSTRLQEFKISYTSSINLCNTAHRLF